MDPSSPLWKIRAVRSSFILVYCAQATSALHKSRKEIAAYSSLSSGDAKNTLDNLVTVVRQHLHASESVTLDGFGTFRIVMKSGGNGVESSDKVSASQSLLTVRFLPCSTRNLDGTLATRSLVDGARCVRFDRATAASGDDGNPDPDQKPDGGGDNGETPDPEI